MAVPHYWKSLHSDEQHSFMFEVIFHAAEKLVAHSIAELDDSIISPTVTASFAAHPRRYDHIILMNTATKVSDGQCDRHSAANIPQDEPLVFFYQIFHHNIMYTVYTNVCLTLSPICTNTPIDDSIQCRCILTSERYSADRILSQDINLGLFAVGNYVSRVVNESSAPLESV